MVLSMPKNVKKKSKELIDEIERFNDVVGLLIEFPRKYESHWKDLGVLNRLYAINEVIMRIVKENRFGLKRADLEKVDELLVELSLLSIYSLRLLRDSSMTSVDEDENDEVIDFVSNDE